MRDINTLIMVERRHLFWKTGTLSDVIRSCIKIARACAQIPGQTMNSIFDALYFIDLKRKPRIVHVKDYIQGVQAGLLFSCKYISIKCYSTLFQPKSTFFQFLFSNFQRLDGQTCNGRHFEGVYD